MRAWVLGLAGGLWLLSCTGPRESAVPTPEEAARCHPTRTVRVNGLDFEYDTFGDKSAPPMLLIMGLGTQMIRWEKAFCEQLAAKGYYVIRFDNRDVGLSSKLRGVPEPSLIRAFINWRVGHRVPSPPYQLAHMAADSVGVMTALGVPKAHIVGASMGGMIAQHVAIHYPEHVLSLTSIMSTTGARDLPPPQQKAIAALMERPENDSPEAQIAQAIKTGRALEGPGYPKADEELREEAKAAYERCFYPAGTRRQLVAIASAPDRTRLLRRLKIPALVIHGKSDPLIPVEAGIATAKAIPGAKLLLLDGVGHELPEQVWPPVIQAMAQNAQSPTQMGAAEPTTF
jgi:pimeloyl-ACP methyl ester carboxylesterase